MASYTVTTSKHATLSAATVDTVTVSSRASAIEVFNRGTSGDIYFTTDGSAPTSAGDDTDVVTPGTSCTVQPKTGAPVAVKLISSSTPANTVRAIV